MHLTLHLTRNCNMRCRYCYAPPDPTAGRMTEETGGKAMELGALRNAGSCGIVFFGGEPLLRRELIHALVGRGREMQRKGEALFHFKTTTNGLLLDDAFLEFSLREDVLVAMSFDGTREAHDAHRILPDGSPSFDLLLPRLRALLDARPYSSVIMVVNPDTVRLLVESVSFLLDLGVRYLIVALNYAGPWDEESLAELKRQYERLGKLYIRWTKEKRKFYLSPFEVKIASHVNAHRADSLRCDLGARQLSVDPDGYLFPCVQFPKAGPESEWCIGHVSGGIDPATFERVRREAHRPKEPCRSCAIEPRCLHTCACLNRQTTGSIHKPSPVLCRHERMLTPIADRVAEHLYAKRDPLFIQKHYNDFYPLLSLIEDQLSAA